MPIEEQTCEICGRTANRLFPRLVEGTLLHVCYDCEDLGEEPVRKPREGGRPIKQSTNTKQFTNLFGSSTIRTSKPRGLSGGSKKKKDPDAIFSDYRVIEDAPNRLLKTRTKAGLSIDAFAESLKIKGQYYNRIEKGATGLPLEIARRIEKIYKIELLELEDAEEEPKPAQKPAKSPKIEEGGIIYFRKRGQKPEYDQT
jgi:uncharacterized protein (TIGR00270 family)